MQGLLTNAAMDLQLWQGSVRRTRRPRVNRRFKQRIYWRDSGICAYCDKHVPFSQATIDHVKPLVRGGSARHKENSVIACSNCNSKKGALPTYGHADLAPEELRRRWDLLMKRCGLA